MRRKTLFLVMLGLVIVGATGCATPATPAMTNEPDPAPTATPKPTEVPPTATPAPTATPTQTSEPTPAATPTEKPVEPSPTLVQAQTGVVLFAITSDAFEHESAIPVKYTCDGDDISPPLAWTDPPEGTQSFALIVDDPDAPGGTWVHWVIFDLPADTRSLPEAVTGDGDLPGGIQGMNSWPRAGYGGPCPPNGTHRYFFTLYAVDTQIALEPGATKADVLTAIEGHVLAEAGLMGTYER